MTQALEQVNPGESHFSPDLEMAERFLTILDGEAETFTFQTFDDSQAKRRTMAKTLCNSLATAAPILGRMNESGAGIFVTINKTAGTRRKAKDVVRVRAVFADFDEGTPPLDESPLPPSMVVESSPGRQHWYWIVEGLPLEQFKPVQRAIAQRLNSDHTVCDLPRVMRLPGFWHRKGDPCQVRLIHAAKRTPYKAEEIITAFATNEHHKQALNNMTEKSQKADKPGDAQAERILKNALGEIASAPEGQRNNTLNREAFKLYGLVKAGRLDRAKVDAALQRVADANGLPLTEIETTMKSAWKGAGTSSLYLQERVSIRQWQPPAPISIEEWQSAKLTPPMLVDRYLYSDLAILVASGGTGKTTLALWEAVHITLGKPLYGRQVARGSVVYLTGEDSRELLTARLREICESMELSPREMLDVRENLRISDVSGEQFKLAVNYQGDIQLNSTVDHLIEGLQETPPALIVVDPYASFSPGEAAVNDGAQGMVLAARKLIRSLGCCVRYIHHVSQEAARSSHKDQYTARGGTALPDGTRMVSVLSSVEDHATAPASLRPLLENGGQLLELTMPKLSYGPKQTPILIARNGWKIAWAKKPSKEQAQQEQAKADEQAALQFLAESLKRGEKHTKTSAKEKHKGSGLPRDRLTAAIDRLMEMNRVVLEKLPDNERQGGRTHYLKPVGYDPELPGGNFCHLSPGIAISLSTTKREHHYSNPPGGPIGNDLPPGSGGGGLFPLSSTRR